MQLVLELLKKIFVAIQGVYTKEESDTALAVRDTSIATNTANIDWLMTAVGGDWKTYFLARAGMTGVQANIDTVNRAIKEPASQLANRLQADWKNLYFYEHFSGIRFERDFWHEFFVAIDVWEANPTTIEWVVNKESDGTYTSNCEHFYNAPTKPVVDFRVIKSTGYSSTKALFHNDSNVVVYLPESTNAGTMFRAGKMDSVFLLPKATTAGYIVLYTHFNKPTMWEGLKSGIAIFEGTYSLNSPVSADSITEGRRFFASARRFNSHVSCKSLLNGREMFLNAESFDKVLSLSVLNNGEDMFKNAGMSAASIEGTLDTLPAHTDGATHTISFVGCPGASELTQDSPSVAAAVAKGWTVEL